MQQADTPNTPLKCGHIGPDWDSKGNCITCARDKILGTTPNTNPVGYGTYSTGKQELREKIEKIQRYYMGGFDSHVKESSDRIEQILSDTVNKVLNELAGKAVNAQTYAQENGSQYGTSHNFRAVPLSAIEQVRKDWK